MDSPTEAHQRTSALTPDWAKDYLSILIGLKYTIYIVDQLNDFNVVTEMPLLFTRILIKKWRKTPKNFGNRLFLSCVGNTQGKRCAEITSIRDQVKQCYISLRKTDANTKKRTHKHVLKQGENMLLHSVKLLRQIGFTACSC